MRHTLLIIAGLLLTVVIVAGCSHRLAALNDPNGEWVPIRVTAGQGQVNLNRVEIGMTRNQVFEIMGTKTHYGKPHYGKATITPHPYKREIVKDGNKEYEILYYYTKHTKGNDSLTPVVLLDGKVSGWGWNYLRSTVGNSQRRAQ